MSKNWIKIILASLASVLMLSGCGFVQIHPYENLEPDLKVNRDTRLAVAVRDVRPYVIDGQRTPYFVGLQNNGYHSNEWAILTGEKPFADNVAARLETSMNAKGAKVRILAFSGGNSEQEAIEKLKGQSNRIVLLSIKDWKTWTFMKTRLDYDLQISVYDAQGNKLAEKEISGTENLGGGLAWPWTHALKASTKALQQKIEILFDDPDIAGNL